MMNHYLPPEILTQIISRLPMPSICLVRRVSKTWYNMITDLFSAKLFNVKALPTNLLILGYRFEYGRTYVEKTWNFFMAEFYVTGDNQRGTSLEVHPFRRESEYDPVASCNGLVLLMVDRYELHPVTYCVSNPIIGQYMNLPFPKDIDSRRYFTGFGFCPSTKQYKVVQFNCRNGMSKVVEIHTLGTFTWTDTQIVVPEHLNNHLWSHNSAGTYLNGALYWMVLRLEDVFIYRFDLETEQFRHIDPPEFKGKKELFLGATAGGQLYISVNSCGVLDLLVMNDFESKSSWTNVFSMNVPEIDGIFWERAIEVIHYGDDRDVIVLGCYDDRSHTFYLVAWKIEAGGRTMSIVGVENTRSNYRPIAYIPNFNSLSEAVPGSTYQLMEDICLLLVWKIRAQTIALLLIFPTSTHFLKLFLDQLIR